MVEFNLVFEKQLFMKCEWNKIGLTDYREGLIKVSPFELYLKLIRKQSHHISEAWNEAHCSIKVTFF